MEKISTEQENIAKGAENIDKRVKKPRDLESVITTESEGTTCVYLCTKGSITAFFLLQ